MIDIMLLIESFPGTRELSNPFEKDSPNSFDLISLMLILFYYEVSKLQFFCQSIRHTLFNIFIFSTVLRNATIT